MVEQYRAYKFIITCCFRICDGCNPLAIICRRRKSSEDHEHGKPVFIVSFLIIKIAVVVQEDSDKKSHAVEEFDSDYELQQVMSTCMCDS